MNGNELYERIRTTFAQTHGGRDVMSDWHELPYTVQGTWEAIARQLPAFKQSAPESLMGLTDDELVKWIEYQPPTRLKLLYFLLNRMGYRI